MAGQVPSYGTRVPKMIEIKIKAGVSFLRHNGSEKREGISTGKEVIFTINGDSLSYAKLSHEKLSCAYLSGTDLHGADLSYATLSMADLSDTNLTGADLTGANLMFTNLENANLSGANLTNAVLHGAKLFKAILKNVILDGAKLQASQYDEQTQWPENFDPCEQGAKKLSEVRLDWKV